MSDKGLAVLGQLFDPKRLHTLIGGSVVIEEEKQATLKRLQIDGVGADAVALWFDQAGHPTPFANGQGVRKACDAILFRRFGDEGYILCVELKSGEPPPEKYAEQLLSAQCFVDYVVSIVKHFYGIEGCAQWQRRFFVFHDASKASIRKEPGKPRFNNDRPDQPWIYQHPAKYSVFMFKN